MKGSPLKKVKEFMSSAPEVKITDATAAMQSILQKRLSEERLQHSIHVASECRRLAAIYHVNEDVAEFSGMVHDICKEMKAEEQEALMKAAGEEMAITPEEWASKKLWHGIAGAQLLKQQYRVGNGNILNAVRYHTVARKDMSQLEKIVYLADMTEEGRSFIDVHVLRAAVDRNLDLGMYYALRISIGKVMQKGGLLPQHTIEAYNQYATIVAEM
jgi:nicotinate-nucleotide adenylyltransferase